MEYKKFSFYPAVFIVPFVFVLLLWIAYYANWRYGWDGTSYGIYPREINGLKGILFSPFLHGDIGHLANNSVAIAVLLTVLCFFYKEHAFKVILLGWLFSGLGTWLIGRPSFHIGASGLVYVFTSFVFFMGLRANYFRLMAVSFLMVILYGGSVWYMLPDTKEGISWEGHLAGFLVGMVLAYRLKKQIYEPHYKYDWQHPDFDESQDEFIRQFDKEGHFNPLPLLKKDHQGYLYNDTFHRKNGTINLRITINALNATYSQEVKEY